MPSLVTPALPSGSISGLRQPSLELDGIVLRPWLAEDRSTVVTAYSDPAIQRWHCRSMTDEEADAWIDAWPDRWRTETGAGWATVEAGTVVGQVSLREIDLVDGRTEVSYWVVPAARGRRVAVRALTALTAWCLGTVGLHRIDIFHSTRNHPSCGVAQRAGFDLEATRRSYVRHADGWHDMHLHTRIA